MGKKKANATVVGRSIIRDRFGHGKRLRSLGGNSFLHTSDLNDGYDWGRLNLQSVTEQSNLDDFLTTAEMAGTEFTAEKLNITFVDVAGNSGLLTKDEKEKVAEAQDKNRNLLCIPRRPAWDETTTPEQLDLKERDAFLQWRRQLAQLQEVEHIVMTPYEKNLDFWRQLWRVIERSDVVVQIVDARNPLLFRSEDLEKYVTQVDDNKLNLLLINKADYLLPAQREAWADYFTKLGVRIAFWSALEETSVVKDTESDDSDIDAESDTEEEEMTREDILPRVENAEVICESQASKVKDISTVQEADVEHSHETKQCFRESDCDVISNEMNVDSTDRRNSQTDSSDVMDVDGAEHSGPVSEESSKGDNSSTQGMVMGDNSSNQDVVVGDNSSTQDVVGDNSSMQDIVVGDNSSTQDVVGDNSSMQDIVVGDNSSTQNLVNRTDEWNSAEILSGAELISLLKNIHKGKTVQDDVTTIGMVGYPNVGKSSTINAILKEKKVPVSATPGRTKHFQTLFVDTDLMLCDCPGLVFPSFVSTKAQLVVSGILPVDQMREHIPPVSLVCDLIPRHVLETEYNINLPLPEECDDENIKPTAHEILSVYGYMRGYMTSKGIPDGPRSSRYILKDFVNGRLLYCHPPPGTSPEKFQSAREAVPKHRKRDRQDNKQSLGAHKPVTSLDHEFFRKSQCKAHSRGVHGAEDYVRGGVVPRSSVSENTASPLGSQSSLNDKPWKKHNNRRKKDKLRRIHADLDK